MSGFTSQDFEEVVLWRGNPDSQAAHDTVLAWLRSRISNFRTSPPPPSSVNVLKGNLGEAIALCLGNQHHFNSYRAFAANANDPIQLRSKPDIDIVWVVFGSNPIEDVAVLQEIKTTGDPSLGYANELLVDYSKLFGVDTAFTLRTRLDAIKNVVEYGLREPELCPRITALAGKSPTTSPKIRLLPTLVHEQSGSDPLSKMSVIRSKLVGTGWPPPSVTAWSIGLDDLDSRLLRLAMGQG